ncbi:hypothetical protein J6590_016483 [Homalodisca vitripennis]|nr:hypothetical protein J6590_016483 [Homalodisca vitripennis]
MDLRCRKVINGQDRRVDMYYINSSFGPWLTGEVQLPTLANTRGAKLRWEPDDVTNTAPLLSRTTTAANWRQFNHDAVTGMTRGEYPEILQRCMLSQGGVARSGTDCSSHIRATCSLSSFVNRVVALDS